MQSVYSHFDKYFLNSMKRSAKLLLSISSTPNVENPGVSAI